MHERLLSRWLQDRKVIGHATRASALARVVGALLRGGRLSLTHLGRSLNGRARTKHQIKAVDRLLGNRHLHRELDRIYQAIAASLLAGQKRPIIIVDWSDVGPDRRCVVLKAASPVGGRAITLYERVFPFKRYNSPSAHGEFLRDLHRILPEGTRPIVVTDAGFHVPWFRDIETYGWDWVGRIRGRIKFYCERMERWRFAHSLHTEATSVPRFVGQADLARRKRHPAQLYIVRAYKVRRGRPRREQVKSGKVQGYRRLYKTPWLLATSLPHEADSARRVKKLYALRMQIEETFRDLKCHRWGFGLRYARSNNAKRLEILVLIGTLASLVAWLVGLAGRTAQWNWSLQANTERKRQVLSTFFIGRQLVARSDFEFSPSLFRLAMAALQRALALSFCT